jgi:hypothetical protein
MEVILEEAEHGKDPGRTPNAGARGQTPALSHPGSATDEESVERFL